MTDTRRRHARAARFGQCVGMGYSRTRTPEGARMRMWRSGSASPCQGEGREFESRHPLEWSLTVHRLAGTWAAHLVAWPRGEAAACKAVHTGSNPVATSLTAPISPIDRLGRLAQR